MRTPRLVALVLVLGGVPSPAARADLTPTGSELQVNTYTTGSQDTPSVAAGTGGDFVVVWQSGTYYGAGQDGSGRGIFGQRHDASGVRLGGEFQANTYTTGAQSEARVAADAAGNFVVAWQSGSYSGAGQDGSAMGVFVQRYASSGMTIGTEFQVNTYTRGNQSSPAVASDAAGNFVVVWQSGSYFGPSQDGSALGIFGQRFDSLGAPLGTEFRVNTYTTGNQYSPAVARDAAGNFIVVWQSSGYPGQDGSSTGVFGQRFANTGAPLGTEFRVNTYTTGYQSFPAVASDPSGDFVVVWQSGNYYGASQDGSAKGIFGQRFSGSGAPVGPEFQVNTYTTGSQTRPAAAAGPDGDFVVVWESRGYPGQDGSGTGVFGQHFAHAGVPLGSEFAVNTYTTGYQGLPSVAADAGGFVVVWTSGYYGSSQDGSDTAAIARRFRTTARALPIPIAGTKLLLTDDPSDPTRKRIHAVSKDAVGAGSGDGSSDDPTLGGGTLRVRSAHFDDTYDLPAANWRYLGEPGQDKGYEYRDPALLAGPVQVARVKNGSVVRIVGRGAQLGHTLAVTPDPVTVILQRGAAGRRDCMTFGGATRFRPGKTFRAIRAPATCP